MTRAIGFVLLTVAMHCPFRIAMAERQRDSLDWGVVAVPQNDGRVFVSWRLLGIDPEGLSFNLYRVQAGKEPARLNEQPITDVTFFIDQSPLENPWSLSPANC